MSTHLVPFKEFIKERCGLQFEGHGEAVLSSALTNRLTSTGTPTPLLYLARLRSDEEEFHALVSLLTINETYFYREREHLELLTTTLVPRLLGHPGARRPLRLLSLGCSTGEEPYSIVMALREAFGAAAAQLVQVTGVDIDHQALSKAAEGRYTSFSFRGLPPELRERYFTREGPHTYLLDPTIRREVAFGHFNLLEEAPANPPPPQEIIFFRNVSIYFDTPTRQRIQRALARLLTPRGVLIVGHSETISNDFGILPLVREGEVFYFAQEPPSPAGEPGTAGTRGSGAAAPPLERVPLVREPPPSLAPPPPLPTPGGFLAGGIPQLPPMSPPPSAPAPEPLPPVAGAMEVDAETWERLLRLTREKAHDAVLAELEELQVPHPGDGRLHLIRAHILAHRRAFEAAERAARRALELREWCPDTLVLLGQIARWREQPREALAWFRRAVYAQPQCWPAHYHLAELYRHAGQGAQALREYRVVLQQLAAPDAARSHNPIFPLAVSLAEVRFLCQKQVDDLQRGEPRNPG